MKVTIDGRSVDAREGETVFELSKRTGNVIPSLCNFNGHENGVCRLCMVQLDGSEKLVPSCSANVHENMTVTTNSDKIIDYRKNLIGLIMKNHSEHTEEKEDKCTLHGFAKQYSVPFTPKLRIESVDRTHPAIEFNPDLCVECRKCVIACNDEQNNDVINISGRGQATHLIFDLSDGIGSSSCVSCGMCVDVCPTGALIEKDWQSAERSVVTTCPYCGVGCTIEYGIRDNRIVWAKGVEENTTNEGKLCVKGKFGYEFEMSKDRLLYPLIRKEGEPRGPLNGRNVEDVFRRSSWNEVLALIAERIKRSREEFGPISIAGIACDRGTNEDVYAFQKFMRATIGSDSVDQSATLCHSPSAAMLSWGLGAGASTNPVHDVFNSRTILVAGSNTDRAHPVVSSYIKKATRMGAHLIVVDPREVELAKKADTFLRIKPGTDTYLFSAMARYIVDNDLYDHEYVENKTEGFDDFVTSLQSFDLDKAAEITGISKDVIIDVARQYAVNKPSSIYWTLGITEHDNGSDNVSSLVNLAILTGNVGLPGTGLGPIRGQNNVQGGADIGGIPGSLPGYQSLMDENVRKKFEANWHVSLPEKPGWKSTEMIENALNGKLKVMYVSGENSMRSHPNSNEVAVALQKLDFLVVQDIFMTETAEFADIVLPAATVFEKSGTFTNTERRIQMVRTLFDPPGEARADWEVYTELSRLLNYDLGFKSTSDIMKEISVLVPTWKGVSHDRLQSGGLQWPVYSEDSGDTKILHVDHAMRGKGRFRPLSWNKIVDMNYPYVMITGRKREQYHTATMTSRSKVISEITEGPYLEMSAQDMKKENLEDGDTVEVKSSTGTITCRVKSSDDLSSGVTFTTFHFADLKANVLTPTVLDPLTKTPAYKDTRIKVRKL